MTIDRLLLTDFRSHGRLDLVAGGGFVALTGPNGAGKTNVLEALSLLAPGRGLRGAALPEMARLGGPGGFAVAAAVAGAVELGTGVAAERPDRRIVRVNGAAAPAAALAERLSLLWLTPAMDRLFTESAGGRRRFLDRLTLALHPGHAREAARYEAAMRARNSLLAEGGADLGWLTALEVRMAEHGHAIGTARADMIAALGTRLATGSADGAFPRPTVAIGNGGPDSVAALAEALSSGRARDAAAGRTLAGPHRADLIVTHADKGIAAVQASTGEQKALLVGLLLGHAALVAERRGRPPVMLLDEVAAHLDPDRRAQLFARLATTGAQVWMTGTEAALFEALPADATRITLG